ncbi:MAG TPA: hypothetical protein VGL81_10550 [Polyangiaceae bacterium]|jgi:hypothetical protein
MTISRGVVACAAVLVAGCGGQNDGEATGTAAAPYKDTDTSVHTPAGSSAGTEDGSPSPPAPPSSEIYVALGRCSVEVGLACTGGYWVREVNTQATWLVKLDLSRLEGAAIEQANGAGAALIFRGQLGASTRTGLATFSTTDAWRGLPDVSPPASDTIVAVASTDGALAMMPVNGTSDSGIESLSVAGFAPHLVDPAWLRTRVLDHGALVAGALQGATLQADQVYVHLPDAPGPCRPSRSYCDGLDEIVTVTRDADRCLVPTGCIHPLPCPLHQPVCAPGYVLSAWPSLPGACAAFACDAAFLGQ